jgi:putative NADH-flavin reductase
MQSQEQKGKIAVLGASGNVGKRIVALASKLGFEVVCQTRNAAKIGDTGSRVQVQVFDPKDAASLDTFVTGAQAVIFALGVDKPGATTFFSEVTAALLPAMKKQGVRRLIAITGVGAGDTRGHGGFVYDWIVFPLFTRKIYADKDRQEAMIAASNLDWTIVRPAPFSEGGAARPLEIYTKIQPDTVLRKIARDEVAAFVVEQINSDSYLRQLPFIGHA